jgi:hypothetical protein
MLNAESQSARGEALEVAIVLIVLSWYCRWPGGTDPGARPFQP